MESHTFSPTAASQFLLGVSDHFGEYRPSHPAQSLAAFPTVLNFWSTGTFTSLGSNANGSCSLDTRTLQISEDLVTNRGSHKLGFGMSIDREYGLEDCVFSRIGQLNSATLRAFYEAVSIQRRKTLISQVCNKCLPRNPKLMCDMAESKATSRMSGALDPQ